MGGHGGVGIEDRLIAALMKRRLRRLPAERAANDSPMSESAPAVFQAQQDLIGRYAPGRSFLDVACLWEIHGGCAFVAEEAGATEVTASDFQPATSEYEAEHERRSSKVRFQQAGLHDTDQVAALGKHDVVWCSGFMYHTSVPYLALANLLAVTNEYLICGSKVIPSVPGLPGAAVYYPGLSQEERQLYEPISHAVARDPFRPETHTANWFWGLSPEALVGLAKSIRPLEVVEEVHLPWCRRHDSYYVVLRVAD
jgi:hypothetical protein